jgi:hypothetical protein
LNGVAESGRDLLETDVFDGTKSMRAKNRCNAGRIETADRAFIDFPKRSVRSFSICLSSSENASAGSM